MVDRRRGGLVARDGGKRKTPEGVRGRGRVKLGGEAGKEITSSREGRDVDGALGIGMLDEREGRPAMLLVGGPGDDSGTRPGRSEESRGSWMRSQSWIEGREQGGDERGRRGEQSGRTGYARVFDGKCRAPDTDQTRDAFLLAPSHHLTPMVRPARPHPPRSTLTHIVHTGTLIPHSALQGTQDRLRHRHRQLFRPPRHPPLRHTHSRRRAPVPQLSPGPPRQRESRPAHPQPSSPG